MNRKFDSDFASPADYEDGFRESDAVRGARQMRASQRLMLEVERENERAEAQKSEQGLEKP